MLIFIFFSLIGLVVHFLFLYICGIFILHQIKTDYCIHLSLSAVSWFISVDNLKENEPEELSTRPSTAWFEPYSRRQPWREPLRQRQVYEDRNQQPGFTHDGEIDPDSRTKTVSSGLVRVSLQVCCRFFFTKWNFTGLFICRFKKCADV